MSMYLIGDNNKLLHSLGLPLSTVVVLVAFPVVLLVHAIASSRAVVKSVHAFFRTTYVVEPEREAENAAPACRALVWLGVHTLLTLGWLGFFRVLSAKRAAYCTQGEGP